MNKQQAIDLVKETFESPFEKGRFDKFVKNLLNNPDMEGFTYTGNYIPDSFKDYVSKYDRVGKYEDGEEKRIDILIVYLKRDTAIDRARSMQRNFVAGYLQGKYGTDSQKHAALVAFVSPNSKDWRFSLVKLDVKLETKEQGGYKVVDEFTPARRWSFLVGSNEKSHTAQTQFVPIIADDENNPTLAELEEAFNIEKVTKEFFEKYRSLFIWTKEELDKAIASDPKTKADFERKGIDTVNLAKKLLGQIIFLYYLQKKGWFGVPREAKWGEGSKNFLRELFDKKHGNYKNFFNDILEPLFYEALRNDRSHEDHYYSRFDCKIPFLNGGLFDPMNNYDWVKTDILLSNELFSNENKTKEGDTGDGILDIFDRYNFTVREDEPFEKEVAIDPELLGKAYEKFNAIRLDNYSEFLKALKSGKKGEESKFNKQYGVYYTPREIVHYMCQQSLINYLYSELNPTIVYQNLGDDQMDMFGNVVKGGQLDMSVEQRPMADIPKEDIALLIQHGESLRENEIRVDTKGKETETYSFQLPESIRKSASLIDEKLASIKVCDPAVGSGAFPVGMMTEIVKARQVLETFTKAGKTVYDLKRECIENSLYGVDIDAGAVEIAKLRLWLSLVVDEDDIQHIKPLPNLDYKVVCGNSLVGFPENWGSTIEKEIETLIRQHFNETNPTKKDELKTQIDEKIEARYKNSLRTFGYQVNFDFKTVFSEVFQRNGGFNVVIANPPYVRQEEIKELKPTLQKQFECYTGTSDLFVYFYEKGIRLLRENGVLVFISSNKYFRSGYGEKLRAYLGRKTRLQQVIDFGDAPVFDALAYPSILVTQKAVPSENKLNVLVWKLDEPLERFNEVLATQTFIMRQTDLTADGWRLGNQIVLSLLEKLRLTGKPLGEYVNGQFYRGVVTGDNNAFVVNRETRDKLIAEDSSSKEILKPYIRGRDINKWTIDNPDLWLIFTRRGIDIKKYPAINKHLTRFKASLTAGIAGGRKPGSYAWFEIQDNTAYWQDFEKSKILYQEIATYQQFAYDKAGMYASKTGFFIPTDDLSLLGLLNSSTIWWFLKNICNKLMGGALAMQSIYIEQIPIPLKHSSNKMTSLVESILAAKRANPQADTSKLEAEIDQLVYQLYGLSPDEIGIVEGKE